VIVRRMAGDWAGSAATVAYGFMTARERARVRHPVGSGQHIYRRSPAELEQPPYWVGVFITGEKSRQPAYDRFNLSLDGGIALNDCLIASFQSPSILSTSGLGPGFRLVLFFFFTVSA
jgi:hypothetical protein